MRQFVSISALVVIAAALSPSSPLVGNSVAAERRGVSVHFTQSAHRAQKAVAAEPLKGEMAAIGPLEFAARPADSASLLGIGVGLLGAAAVARRRFRRSS